MYNAYFYRKHGDGYLLSELLLNKLLYYFPLVKKKCISIIYRGKNN